MTFTLIHEVIVSTPEEQDRFRLFFASKDVVVPVSLYTEPFVMPLPAVLTNAGYQCGRQSVGLVLNQFMEDLEVRKVVATCSCTLEQWERAMRTWDTPR